MFYKMPEASKVCFAKLVEIALENDFHFIDCQVPTPHLEKTGCQSNPKGRLSRKLNNSLADQTKNFNWSKI